MYLVQLLTKHSNLVTTNVSFKVIVIMYVMFNYSRLCAACVLGSTLIGSYSTSVRHPFSLDKFHIVLALGPAMH